MVGAIGGFSIDRLDAISNSLSDLDAGLKNRLFDDFGGSTCLGLLRCGARSFLSLKFARSVGSAPLILDLSKASTFFWSLGVPTMLG